MTNWRFADIKSVLSIQRKVETFTLDEPVNVDALQHLASRQNGAALLARVGR